MNHPCGWHDTHIPDHGLSLGCRGALLHTDQRTQKLTTKCHPQGMDRDASGLGQHRRNHSTVTAREQEVGPHLFQIEVHDWGEVQGVCVVVVIRTGAHVHEGLDESSRDGWDVHCIDNMQVIQVSMGPRCMVKRTTL